MVTTSATSQSVQLASQTRQFLVAQAATAMESLVGSVQDRLTELMNEAAPSREMQLRRDAWMAYQRFKNRWRDGTVQAWQVALLPPKRSTSLAVDSKLALLGTEVVENKILASRLAQNLVESAVQEIGDLRKRLKALNGDQELSSRDIVHPDVLMLPLVEQWEASGLSRDSWPLVSPVIQRHFNEQMKKAYALCNEKLIAKGVLPVIDFGAGGKASVRSTLSGNTERGGVSAPAAEPPRRRAEDRAVDGRPAASGQRMGGNIGSPTAGSGWRTGRVQGVLEQVGRLLGGLFQQESAPAGSFVAGSPAASPGHVAYAGPSVPLMAAMAQQPRLSEDYFVPAAAGAPQAGYPVVLERVASELRQQTTDLKGKAETDNEKAIIELVALMFQSILQEDRIPTGVRVWFARLQMPVLRIALAEPDFFNKLDHPARQLIDHMGSCVLGFDASGISSEELETEIKRVVQVIEQYPDTGDRVYRRVYEEFQAFLKKHLAKKPSAQKVLGVAEQLEQKETLSIQYTIEMRDQLKDMPVRDEIREFLFKVWAEVLAVSTVRQGGQHEETLLLKKTATDLIWAASAKPNRTDRARVIADLPELLQCLRTGMTLLGTVRSAQEAHIKIISDTLADAFMSKTQAIADVQIQALAQRLANLDDFVNDDGSEELPLDSENIEELLGIETTELDVVSDGGGTASAVMMEWARELALGSWFTLSYNSQVAQVQYVWRSPLGHLHLFANNVGHSYLFQSVRLAAYLQAGMLEPQEDEPLMMRAARSALGEIEANPARLLS
jgi:hypothetical protein